MKNFSQFNESYIGDIPNQDNGYHYLRLQQPQLDDLDTLKTDLTNNGIGYSFQIMPTNSLIPTQSEFNDDKVVSIVDNMMNSPTIKPIIVSNDNYVIDGHHRWLGADAVDGTCPTMKINLPLETIHNFLKNKDYVGTRTINESDAEDGERTVKLVPVDDDYLAETSFNGKQVKLYKPELSKGKTRKYTVHVKNQTTKKVEKKEFGGSHQEIIDKMKSKKIDESYAKIYSGKWSNRKPKSMSMCINEILMEGYYIDTLRRQLVDLARLRVGRSDIPNNQYGLTIEKEVDRIANLSPESVVAEYEKCMVDNDIDAIPVTESYTDWTHTKLGNLNFKDYVHKVHHEFHNGGAGANSGAGHRPSDHVMQKAWSKRVFDMQGKHDAPNDDSIAKLKSLSTHDTYQNLLDTNDHRLNYLAAKHGGEAIHKQAQHHTMGIVRAEAAQSESTHAHLKDDPASIVRFHVALHSNDHKILKKLAADPDIRVAQVALGRSKQINNPKHAEVFSQHQIKHHRVDDDINLATRGTDDYKTDFESHNLTRGKDLYNKISKPFSIGSLLAAGAAVTNSGGRRRR